MTTAELHNLLNSERDDSFIVPEVEVLKLNTRVTVTLVEENGKTMNYNGTITLVNEKGKSFNIKPDNSSTEEQRVKRKYITPLKKGRKKEYFLVTKKDRNTMGRNLRITLHCLFCEALMAMHNKEVTTEVREIFAGLANQKISIQTCQESPNEKVREFSDLLLNPWDINDTSRKKFMKDNILATTTEGQRDSQISAIYLKDVLQSFKESNGKTAKVVKKNKEKDPKKEEL
jgi:hypothetical protein